MHRSTEIDYSTILRRYPIPRTVSFRGHRGDGRGHGFGARLSVSDGVADDFDLRCRNWSRDYRRQHQKRHYERTEPDLRHGGQVCPLISVK